MHMTYRVEGNDCKNLTRKIVMTLPGPYCTTHQLWYLFAPLLTASCEALQLEGCSELIPCPSEETAPNKSQEFRCCVGCAVENRFWTS